MCGIHSGASVSRRSSGAAASRLLMATRAWSRDSAAPGQVRAEGHGLGLSIVRRIIERLDGHVGVESRSEGSRFYFTLPAADV